MTNFQCELTLCIICVHGHDDATQKTALLQQEHRFKKQFSQGSDARCGLTFNTNKMRHQTFLATLLLQLLPHTIM